MNKNNQNANWNKRVHNPKKGLMEQDTELGNELFIRPEINPELPIANPIKKEKTNDIDELDIIKNHKQTKKL